MLPHDYHVHTHFSCDCEVSMQAMCTAALKRGVSVIGFSEHYDLIPQDPCYAFFHADGWWEALAGCRQEFAGQLEIRAGIEVGEPHLFPTQVAALLRRYPWDYVLGSLHWVSETLIFHSDYYQQTPQAAYGDYFAQLLTMVEQGEFDILAHFDIVKRYGYENYGVFQPTAFEEPIRKVLRACAERGIALELNTSTLRRSVNEISPSSIILRWFGEEGGKHFTIGSDAHQPEDVAAGFDQALALLNGAGFPNLVDYQQRQPQPTPTTPR